MNVESINLNGKKVGEIINKTTYLSRRKKSKHLHRVSDSWGLDSSLLDILRGRGVTLVVIYDGEGRVAYYAQLSRFITESFFLDFGHGVQKFMKREQWSKANLEKLLTVVTGMKEAM